MVNLVVQQEAFEALGTEDLHDFTTKEPGPKKTWQAFSVAIRPTERAYS
jgi:hypothetical protein